MARYDTTTKHLIEGGPADWLALAGLPLPASPEAVTVVDAELSTITTAPDKLIRVDDVAVPYVAHVEFQTGPDPDLDGRVLVYNVLARWRHRLPVRSVVYLLRPAARTPHLSGGVREMLDDRARLEFDYRLIRVWELPVEVVLAGGLATLPLAPIAAVTPAGLPAVVGRIRDRLAAEASEADAAEMWVATGILMTLKYRRRVVAGLLHGARTMRESWLYQDILAEGRLEGRVEGRSEGRVEGERNLLLRQGGHKFGPADPAVRARLDAITDAGELERLGVALLTAATWDQLLAGDQSPAGGRAGRRRK